MEVKTVDDLRFAAANFVLSEFLDEKNGSRTNHEVFDEFVKQELSWDAVGKTVKARTKEEVLDEFIEERMKESRR